MNPLGALLIPLWDEAIVPECLSSHRSPGPRGVPDPERVPLGRDLGWRALAEQVFLSPRLAHPFASRWG